MIDILYAEPSQQAGLIHSKVAGRFEIVKQLPKDTDSFQGMFTYANAFGKIRLAYIDTKYKADGISDEEHQNATAIGGEFGFNTAAYNGMSLHIAAYVSQTINFLSPSKDDMNGDFVDVDKNSFIYISEISLDYASDLLQAKLGRLKVETPYANSDDIRMAPNTFEGAWFNLDYTDTLRTQVFYFDKWAGFDSQDEDALVSQNEFKPLVANDSFGMAGASLTYEYAKNSEMSLWYNYIDDMAAITYAEIAGIYFINEVGFHLDYGFQASNISELNDSGVDGNVLGMIAILHYDGAFIGTAYNASFSDDGKHVTDGFGGGPYYTSMDEATIAAISEISIAHNRSENNAQALRIGAGYEFEQIGLDGFVGELVYAKLDSDHGSIIEKDAIVTYELEDRWYVEGIYANYKSSVDDQRFQRALVRLDYSF